MKLSELNSSKDYTMKSVECKLIHPFNSLVKGLSGAVVAESEQMFIFQSATLSRRVRFRIPDISEAKMLYDRSVRRFFNLAEIVQIKTNESGLVTEVFLHITFFIQKDWFSLPNVSADNQNDPFAALSIFLEKDVITKLERKKIFVSQLPSLFTLNDGENSLIAYTNGNYHQELERLEKLDSQKQTDDSEEDEEEKSQPVFNLLSDRRIKLFGKGITLYVRKRSVTEDDSILVADKVTFKEPNPPCMKLAVCNLKFSEKAEYITQQVAELFQDKSTYLKLWEEYANREGDVLLKTARAVGVLHFTSNPIGQGQTVLIFSQSAYYEEALNYLSAGDILVCSDDIPDYLQDETMEWKEYRQRLIGTMSLGGKYHDVSYKIISIDKRKFHIYIQTNGAPIKNTAFLSIFGDLQQIIRRERVRMNVMKGECAYPALWLLIEGKSSSVVSGLKPPKAPKKIHSPVTAFVQKKIFPQHPPTDNQKEAIRIALNTPDIVLIQGPPGTGKTTVINAIVECLNEMENKKESIKARVLITSTQHDAVTNLTERMHVNGIPTPKYGKKSTDSENYGDDNILQWCNGIKERMEQKYPYISAIERKHRLDLYFNLYQNSPSVGNAVSFLKFAQSLNTNPKLHEPIEMLLKEFTDEPSETKDVSEDMMTLIRRIRTKKESFLDDGAENALDLYSRLREISNFSEVYPQTLQILRNAARTDNEAVTPELLKQLRKEKKMLMELYVPKPHYRKEQMDERIIDIYIQMKDSVVSLEDEEQQIIFDFYNELDNNQLAIKSALSEYSYALGATLQQSASSAVAKIKTGNQKGVAVQYDTVIVDEAARANPGDLLIPLSQASKRIILVGDHRQLPHMYKEEIFKELSEDETTVNAEDISKSMFQHLWEKAKELEKIDGIQRTIHLNNQYRTHPLLGEFVSHEFYEPYGESYHSPLPAELFQQDLYDHPLHWVHMPAICGEMSSSASKSRVCEADYIAEKLDEFITSDAGKNLTYGVITFYSSQASLIRKRLKPSCENVRVGSVDAFQGMEFDVIFLSVVRTESNGKRSYGFLQSVNRLCVALSRQKKLLIIVGDGDMFSGTKQGEIAEKVIPSMKHIYELCQERGWIEDYAKLKGYQ